MERLNGKRIVSDMKNKKFYLSHLVFECPNFMQRSILAYLCIAKRQK